MDPDKVADLIRKAVDLAREAPDLICHSVFTEAFAAMAYGDITRRAGMYINSNGGDEE